MCIQGRFEVNDTIMLGNGNNLDLMPELPDESVDAVITDPPYGISFMCKKWDDDCPKTQVWQECLRVLKPGGYLLSFSGTRTIDLVMGRIREAGFEVRDTITWLYGSGFPKSHNISKAIDKMKGAEREVIGFDKTCRLGCNKNLNDDNWNKINTQETPITKPATTEAKQWDGWGTALKPACEFIVMARKPLSEKSVAENVLKHGTGGINIDACRIDGFKESVPQPMGQTGKIYGFKNGIGRNGEMSDNSQGRFPANLILDEESAKMLDEQSGVLKSGAWNGEITGSGTQFNHLKGKKGQPYFREPEEGGASRFFYCAKTPVSEKGKTNSHPTVKPQDSMEYLIKMITTKKAYVLDCFMGSGSTGVACKSLDRKFIGIELSKEYYEIAKERIEKTFCQMELF